MFKKSAEAIQINIFTSPTALFSGNTLKFYENKTAWHNLFRQQVTMRIDEGIFSPLYCNNNGTPTTHIRTLVAMMILKEADRLSDSKLFESCRFNMLTRSALGLLNADDLVPTESTYYLFRKNIYDYANTGNENLFDTVFAQITKDQCLDLDVSGKRIRMDSKLLGSNIAWLSRYEIIHETLRLFYKQAKEQGKIDAATEEKLDSLLQFKGNKVVYTCTTEEVKTKLQELGELIYKILPLFSDNSSTCYETLKRVFNEQFNVDKNKLVVSRKNDEISAQSVQSPHDTTSTYRDKDGNKIKGFSINATESCDDEKALNLIARVDVRTVSTSDVDFFEDNIEEAQEVFPDKIENVHVDGAYHSPSNQLFCQDNNINLYLHAIQGAKGRFQFFLMENGEYSIMDTQTSELILATKFITKNDITKWRITVDKKYRYFTQEYIDNCLIRSKIEDTPVEILQKRNNVEATVFQLGFHYPNDKSRYRGLIKHQMWANMRALWVNFVRIAKHIEKICQRTFIIIKQWMLHRIIACFIIFKPFVRAIMQNNIPLLLNMQISEI
jgi:hypothetical protein